MNTLLEWFSRKRVLIASFFPGILSVYLINKAETTFVNNIYGVIGYYLALFGLIFIVAIIISFFKDSVFVAWKKFTFIYLFIFLFIYLFIPLNCGFWDFMLCKTEINLLLMPIYLIVVFILILYKTFKKEKPTV